MNQRRTIRLVFGAGLPMALLVGALVWMGLPLGQLFALQPDLALGLLIGCPLATTKSALKLLNDIHKEETIDDDLNLD